MWPSKKDEREDAADDEAKASRRSLVRRLDIFFASYCVLAYTMKYIDQQAHTNAYVSGMKEDLHLVGNELNMINAMFSVGQAYAVGTIPSQILVAKFRPSLVIPLFEVTWSLLIMVNAAAKNAGLLYGMRLLIGLLESIAYPGFISTLTAWYTPAELAKRIALVQASSAAGSMFSGYLAAGMLKGMQGVGGLEAWRWLFIFDGCISLPIAIAGFFCIPDHPETTRVKWLKPEHIAQARDRMREIGRAPKGRLTVAKFLKIFKEWPIYLMLAIYPFEIVTSQAISYFALYLKSNPSGRTFTQYQVNLIPTGGQALQIVATLIFASMSDRLGRRWQVLCCQVGLGVIGYILLNAWDSVGFNGQFAGYMLIYCTVGSGALSLTWYSEFCSADAEIRTLIIGLCNGIGYAFIAGFPFIMFPNVQAPRYKVGYKMGLAFYLWTIVGSILIAFLLRRYGRPYTKTATQEAEDESVRSQSREDHGDIEQKLEEPVAEGNAKERNRADEGVPQLRN